MKFSSIKNLIRDDKFKKIFLIVLVCLIGCLSVAYAAMSVTLNITGNAEVVAAGWDIHLDNVSVTNGSSGTTPTITSSTSASFETTLSTPGDFYEFTIDVVNDGTIDAMIESVEKTPTLTTEQAKYINYVIEYQNGEAINTKQAVAAGSFVRLKVRVEYRKDISTSDLPTSSTTLDLAFKVVYSQSDGTESSVTDNGVKQVVNVVSGDADTVGSEICISDECFYVISSDDDSVTMLSKYNLYVGNIATWDSLDFNEYELTTITNPTGIQNSQALGAVIDSVNWVGTVAFSSKNYWSGSVSSYPAYVYDSNSTLYTYIANYENYLEEQGATIEESRPITYEELVALGCNASSYTCESAPSWVYSTTYWSGSADITNLVWYVSSSAYFGSDSFSFDDGSGVRPVITISKSLI